MASISQEIIVLLQAERAADGHPLKAVLTWDEETSYEVQAAFFVGVPEPVKWVFGRDLLIEAFAHPGTIAGKADVRVLMHTDSGQLGLTLSSPYGDAAFRADAGEVKNFLKRTLDAVAREAEIVDVDATLAELLRES